MQKKVFIIIVTFNGEKWIEKNLQALTKSLFPIEIIVIDNQSSDNTVSVVNTFANVQLILSDENIGFGRANNIAIKQALLQGADYVFLLNQDAWVFPETIKNLVSVAILNPEFGIVSPMHYSGDGITLDENFEMYRHRKTNSISNNVDAVPFINAAAWLVPKKVIEKVGYFEPMFSHYGEDRNYADRVLYHHFKTVIVTDAKICHDRVVVRNFQKDLKQSKFKMLTQVLNINHALFLSYLKTFRSVLGLPKYFSKHYSFFQVITFFFELLWYYTMLKLNVFKIYKTRAGYK